MDIEKRVNHYIGNLKIKKWNIEFNKITEIYTDIDTKESFCDISPAYYGTYYINKDFTISDFTVLIWNKYNKLINFVSWANLIVERDIISYVNPMIELFNSDNYFKEHGFLTRPGDVVFNTSIPIITKTRPIGESCNVLINLEAERHWGELKTVEKNDINFKDKNNKVIWRGAMNGFWEETSVGVKNIKRSRRRILCEKYWNSPNIMIDVGFSTMLDDGRILINEGMIKKPMSVEEQLKSKFLISVEGGDVATNLKWMMHSNSTILMPPTTICSWFMEDTLVPWVHYVPLDREFDDLEEKYNWCLNNLDKCEEIANNGKKYVEQFLDIEKEKIITDIVLRKYIDNVKIKLISE